MIYDVKGNTKIDGVGPVNKGLRVTLSLCTKTCVKDLENTAPPPPPSKLSDSANRYVRSNQLIHCKTRKVYDLKDPFVTEVRLPTRYGMRLNREGLWLESLTPWIKELFSKLYDINSTLPNRVTPKDPWMVETSSPGSITLESPVIKSLS